MARDERAGQPTLTEEDQRAAIARLRQRAADGDISDRQLAELTAAVWRCNTPHELYARTHGACGSRTRRDKRDWARVVAFWLAVLVVLVLLTWLTAMAARDGLFGGS